MATFTLIGVVLGAGLHYLSTIKIEKEKHWDDLRAGSYIQYVENTAKLSALEDKEKLEEARSLRNSARFMIALYGSKDVIQQMKSYAMWEENRPEKGSPQEDKFKESSLLLFNSIRNEIMPPNESVDKDDLRPILFPSEFLGSKSN